MVEVIERTRRICRIVGKYLIVSYNREH